MKELPQIFLDELHKEIVDFHQATLEMASMATAIVEKAKRRVADYRIKKHVEEHLESDSHE